jgi:3-dehydroquinate dehydratase
MNFDQCSAVASTPACKPTERALDLIDDDTDATEIRFDLLLRQDKVRHRACRFSTLAAARMERGLFCNGHWTCLLDVGLFT